MKPAIILPALILALHSLFLHFYSLLHSYLHSKGFFSQKLADSAVLGIHCHGNVAWTCISSGPYRTLFVYREMYSWTRSTTSSWFCNGSGRLYGLGCLPTNKLLQNHPSRFYTCEQDFIPLIHFIYMRLNNQLSWNSSHTHTHTNVFHTFYFSPVLAGVGRWEMAGRMEPYNEFSLQRGGRLTSWPGRLWRHSNKEACW